MTEPDGDLAARVAILADALADLEDDEAFRDHPSHRPATAEELRLVATEVTIPAAVAVLDTNVRVLERLQGRASQADEVTSAPDHVDAEGPDAGDEVARILERAAALQADVDAHLASLRAATGDEPPDLDREPVAVDVDAELEAIRREVNAGDGDEGGDTGDGKDGNDASDGVD